MELQRLTEWQAAFHRLSYNEIIVDAPHWRTHMPAVIDAIFGDRDAHAQFLQDYAGQGVTAETHPFLVLDPMSWDVPFAIG